MAKKKSEIALTQDALNELGAEMHAAMEKFKEEHAKTAAMPLAKAQNAIIAQVQAHIRKECNDTEMVTVQSVIDCLESFKVTEEDEAP